MWMAALTWSQHEDERRLRQFQVRHISLIRYHNGDVPQLEFPAERLDYVGTQLPRCAALACSLLRSDLRVLLQRSLFRRVRFPERT